MITFAIKFLRRGPCTFKFDSHGGFAYRDLRLHSSTNHSVGSRKCHCSVSASLIKVVTECWPCLPSPSPFGWDLGPDWPRGDWHCPGNLSLAAGGNLTLLIVTYTYICFSISSRISYPHHSTDMECSPTDTFIIAIPRLRYLSYTRLLSMQGLSTSELLRTLWMNGCFQANILAVTETPLR